jgi:glycosyltransferase involved in cell wall biosynthesis
VRVSIVIDNYNYERFLGDAIASALDQTHPDVEVIVVDDGSTDGSRDVIAGFAGRITPVLQENRGQGGAFNAGFAAASGEVVLFLDADDLLLRDAAAAAAAHGADHQVSQVHWRLLDMDAAGVASDETTPGDALADGDVLDDLLNDGPLSWSSPPTSGNAWPRRYLEKVMPIPEAEFRIAADAYLVALAPLYGRVRGVERVLGYYRRHETNHWGGSFDDVARANRDVIRKLMPVVAEHAGRCGVRVDPEQWERASYDIQLPDVLEDLDTVIGRSTPFVLVDGQQLALGVSGRPAIPFLERDGVYWGEPSDDAEAIAELARLRSDGARFLVLAWPSFWWKDHYPEFMAHVRRSYPCRLENQRLIVFELADRS